jgi:hypothetical protein
MFKYLICNIFSLHCQQISDMFIANIVFLEYACLYSPHPRASHSMIQNLSQKSSHSCFSNESMFTPRFL